jgi:hypothetical protein
MILIEDYYTQKVNISSGANEPQNVTFIDISNFKISFAPVHRVEQIIIPPKFVLNKTRQKEGRMKLHPFLQS